MYDHLDNLNTFAIINASARYYDNVNLGEISHKLLTKLTTDENLKIEKIRLDLEKLLNFLSKELRIPPFKISAISKFGTYDEEEALLSAYNKFRNRIAIPMWDDLFIPEEFDNMISIGGVKVYKPAEIAVLGLQELLFQVAGKLTLYTKRQPINRGSIRRHYLDLNAGLGGQDTMLLTEALYDLVNLSNMNYIKYKNFYKV